MLLGGGGDWRKSPPGRPPSEEGFAENDSGRIAYLKKGGRDYNITFNRRTSSLN